MTTRLLVVAMANSPHLHRWVRAIADDSLTIVVFPALQTPQQPDAVVRLAELSDALPTGVYTLSADDVRSQDAAEIDRRWHYEPRTHHFVSPEALASADRLATAIARFRPHLVHSMETQVAGYLVAELVRRNGKQQPWIHSTWGSDIALYGRMRAHQSRLRSMFRDVDVHLADCPRDVALARALGYRGRDMPALPSSGGVDVDDLAGLARQLPSERRRIMVKGYHNWAGRNLLALSALMLIADELADYEIVIPKADSALREWAGIMSNRTALKVRVLPDMPSEVDAIAELAEARLLISLSISDGLATMVLEAMAVGAFPIQSKAGCSHELFGDGVGGLVVPANDTRAVADAILRALRDDALVDDAATQNLATVRQRWDRRTNGALVRDLYRESRTAAQ
ncbi:glycosyltransferase family 4 protein [Plastoroseomonas hellenica]|uniref:glycosyltransferase family 4 protein n=1 Tax=Plastoroseomonas hellenica TaxID=2687306 RepID=UPI001BACA983|nr:glycosyltransferase family 4 protein [Plastoroseomonas hellenica]MBR0641461.1 glycosyltransferase family 4 protein [Plastoroseomonas hellenica]